MADWKEQCPPKRGGWVKPQSLPGDGSLSPPTCGQTAGGAGNPNVGDTLVYIDPIHLLCPLGKETPVAFSDPLAWSFFILTLMMLVSSTVVHMYGGLMIQALDVIEGGRGIEHKASCDAPLDHPQIHLPLYKGDPRALIAGLVPYSSCGQDQFPHGLGFSLAPFPGGPIAPGASGPASHSSPLMWKAKLTVATWRVMMSCRLLRY